jgi:hypothetical protein
MTTVEEEIRNLIKVHQTVRKMLKKRGYTVDDVEYDKLKEKMDAGMKRGESSFSAEKYIHHTATTMNGGGDVNMTGDGEDLSKQPTEKIFVFFADERELFRLHASVNRS